MIRQSRKLFVFAMVSCMALSRLAFSQIAPIPRIGPGAFGGGGLGGFTTAINNQNIGYMQGKLKQQEIELQRLEIERRQLEIQRLTQELQNPSIINTTNPVFAAHVLRVDSTQDGYYRVILGVVAHKWNVSPVLKSGDIVKCKINEEGNSMIITSADGQDFEFGIDSTP